MRSRSVTSLINGTEALSIACNRCISPRLFNSSANARIGAHAGCSRLTAQLPTAVVFAAATPALVFDFVIPFDVVLTTGSATEPAVVVMDRGTKPVCGRTRDRRGASTPPFTSVCDACVPFDVLFAMNVSPDASATSSTLNTTTRSKSDDGIDKHVEYEPNTSTIITSDY